MHHLNGHWMATSTALEATKYTRYPTHVTHSLPSIQTHVLSILRPTMIPSLPRGKIRLTPRILHRHTSPNPSLHHSRPIQPSNLLPLNTKSSCIGTLASSLRLAHFVAIRVEQTQVLARCTHRHVLALEVELLGAAALAQEEHPGAVDGPVAEEAVAGEVEGPRG